MEASSISPEEMRAAAEVHAELGPEYQKAVLESFLDRLGREIDARVDARLAQRAPTGQPQPAEPARPRHSPITLAVWSMAFGIPLSAIVVSAGAHPVGLPGLVVIWIALTVINVAYAVRLRPPGSGGTGSGPARS